MVSKQMNSGIAFGELEGRMYRITALVCLVLATILWGGPAIWRNDLFDGDAAHHVFWLYQYADSALFPNDLSIEYLRTSAPLGYRMFYAGIAHFMDVLHATELLSAALYLLSGLLAWRIGTVSELPGRSLRGLLAVLAFILLVEVGRLTGGILPPLAFQRTFALPLVLWCLWGLMTRRYIHAGYSWLGAALFYPVVLPVLGLAAGCVFLRDLLIDRKLPSAWLPNGLMGVAALGLAIFGMPQATDLGPAVTFKEAMTMPEYGLHGRLQLHVPGVIGDWFWFHMMGLGWPPLAVVAIAAAWAVAWACGKRALIPGAAWAVLGVGVSLWLIVRLFAEQLMFGLYLPNRHSRWAVAAFGIVALAAGSYAVIDVSIQWLRLRWGDAGARAAASLVVAAAPLIVLSALLPHAWAEWKQPVDKDLENTYAFIASLPKSTLVAAHPDLANYIPLRTRRSVLTSTETSMPWLWGYYARVKPRVEASLRAAYATDVKEIDAQLAPFGVNVFVTGPQVWNGERYLDPYNDLVNELRDQGRDKGFALQHPPQERVLFQSGDYFVLRVGGSGE